MSEKTLGEVGRDAYNRIMDASLVCNDEELERMLVDAHQAAADAIAAPLLARIAELEGEVKYLESGKATFAAHFKTLNQHNDALSAEVARLIPLVPHPGDGTCDCCGAAPAVAIPTALCDSCLADNNTAYHRGVAEERERCAKVAEGLTRFLSCGGGNGHGIAESIRSASPAVDATSDKGGER